MRSVLLITAVLIGVVTGIVTAVAVEATVDYLRARSTGSEVVIEWRSGDESNVRHYVVERAGEDQVFRAVTTIRAEGSNKTYTYKDTEAFGKDEGADRQLAGTYFTYRLNIVMSDNSSTYSTTAGVSHNVSTVKRTWGMIKEMFR